MIRVELILSVNYDVIPFCELMKIIFIRDSVQIGLAPPQGGARALWRGPSTAGDAEVVVGSTTFNYAAA